MLAYFGVLAVLLLAVLVCMIVAASKYGSGDNLGSGFWLVLSIAGMGILIWFAIDAGDYDKTSQECRSQGYTWVQEHGCYDLRHIPQKNLDKVLTPEQNQVK
ncbi:hypothetical protein FDI69_gp198 [Rhodococcus phage Trina]|uniref:Uncharacterized protein n=1 Tax=Rhodococcus phage Trina TaxID=2027905 RepID=A0A2D0ZNN2_9CAUD|nr:hypothetical protein FDI69_gp198 [Rhodococcus phage Trina]ASZ74988.1 hypothetical protein SEA_TRINA_209 [Rhodococcus phage Trina]